MPGSPDTLPAPDLPAGRRLALVVATTTYADPALRHLRAPAHDGAALGAVLADPAVGNFAVTSVVDGRGPEIRLTVEEFLSDRDPDDLLLVYLSCHGLVDARRRLYFAAADTLKNRLAATGVEAQWLLEQLDDCRARRQVLILDCCFSGAFARGAKGEADLALGERFHAEGRGRVVLTASRASEYSFEGEPLPDASMPGSVFTRALVAGLRTGAADRDGDGYVSVDDAYGFAFDQVRASDAAQTPQRWLYGAEGDILLARSPAGIPVAPAPLPDPVRAAMDSADPAVRLGGVAALGEWLAEADPGRVLAARAALQAVADGDVPRVAQAARARLAVADPPHAALPLGTGVPDSLPAPTSTAPTHPAAARRAGAARRRAWLAAAVVVLLGAAGVVVLLVTRQPPAGGPASSASGTISESGPWRLVVRDAVSGHQDPGCSVTVTAESGASQGGTVFTGVYGTKSFQVAPSGTFHWAANDAGCLVAARAGPGAAALPFVVQQGQGDSDAFTAPATLLVQVIDFAGTVPCDLVLRAADDGRTLDLGTADPAHPTVQLHSGGAAQAYLVDPTCSVRIAAG